MSIRKLINSPDFKNIQLAIELNLYSREIRGLADFYKGNRGKWMDFYEFTDKFSRLCYREGIKLDVTFNDYGAFETFSEYLAGILDIKIYYGGSIGSHTICKDWGTMDRIISGIGIVEWIKTRNNSCVDRYKLALPF